MLWQRLPQRNIVCSAKNAGSPGDTISAHGVWAGNTIWMYIYVDIYIIKNTYPGTLASNKLVILSLHAGPAAHIKVLCFKVWVVQLLRGLPGDSEEEKRVEQEKGGMMC